MGHASQVYYEVNAVLHPRHFHNQKNIRLLIGAAIEEGIEVHAQTEEVLRRDLASQGVMMGIAADRCPPLAGSLQVLN